MLLAGVLLACGTEPSPPPPPFAGKIVFASDRATLDGRPQLYSMNPDGTDIRLIPIPLPGPMGDPDVSPDGEVLAFSKGGGTYTVRANGTNLRRLLASDLGSRPRWSPAGARLAFDSRRTGAYDVWIMDASGTNQTNVTRTPDFNESGADWSPDGQLLVYSRRPTDGTAPAQLWTIHTDGTGATQVTSDAVRSALWPAFSPDGAWIAYASGDGAPVDLRLIRPDGTGDHSIFRAEGPTVNVTSWSPDGTTLAIWYGTSIAVIGMDGSGFRIVTDSGFNSAPAWGPALP